MTNRLKPEWRLPPQKPFELGPGDTIEVESIGEASSAVTLPVGPDGRIYYSLLPGQDVWGLTLRQTKALLEKEMQKYQKEAPQLAISLRTAASKRVWLLGRLANPGVYPLSTPMTVLEAVSQAGGIPSVVGTSEDSADLRHSFVLRQGELIPVDFERLLRKGDLSQNIYLEPDDFVYLKSAETRVITVMGHVRTTTVMPYRQGMTLISVLAAVGGPIRDAHLAQVTIVRGSLGNPTVAWVNYKDIISGKAADVLLEPNDIVYVPKAPWALLEKYVNLIIEGSVRSAAINAGYASVYGPGGVGVGVSVPIAPATAPPSGVR